MRNIPVRSLITSVKHDPFDSFVVRRVAKVFPNQPQGFERHRHDFFYLLALEKGAGQHEIDFVTYDINDYSIFFLRPGQVHLIDLKPGASGFLLTFGRTAYSINDPFLRKASAKNLCQSSAAKSKKTFAILHDILDEYTEKEEGYQEVIRANLSILFTELVRQCSKDLPPAPDTYSQVKLQELLELIERNVAQHKQISFYADRISLSPYQLNSITKSTLGKTCSEVINEHIILEAKRYLLATTNQVSQISHHLGYDDVSYFIRFFKKHTGSSPEAFRQNFR